jgi:hypothetical protein
MVDARVSNTLTARCVGSSPTARTNIRNIDMSNNNRFERAGAATGKFVDDKIEQARQWIYKNVPHHTQHEYEMQMNTGVRR